ncbi:MAG: S46 family peptidase [Prevotellaceae bacterium]|nr:S46 family peptidase [Prevotellaceae bacterium]
MYSLNNSSLKDAIVNIRGCTYEIVSDRGLLLTNHHCGLNRIQYHSSVDNDYLRNTLVQIKFGLCNK